MTLVEMAIVVIAVGVGLFLLVGWTNSLRLEAKQDLALRMLADLDVALSRYYRSTGCTPTSFGPDSAINATVDLLDHDKTRPLLEAFPDSVWQGPGRRNLVDPWGTPLHYFAAGQNSDYVKANNDRPVFVSAGPDCGFGDKHTTELGDNLRSDDPGVEGFRLYHVMREALMEQEQEDAEEND